MEIFTLGTSGAVPTKERRLISTAIRIDDGSFIILDIGEDFQRAFNEAKLKFNKYTLIFISHMHADHISGLPGFLASLSLKGRTEPLVIIGPQGIFPFIFSLIKYLNIAFISETTIIEYNVDLNDMIIATKYKTKGLDMKSRKLEFSQEEYKNDKGIIFQSKRYTLKLKEMEHSVKSAGMRIEFPEKPGKFNIDKVKEMNIPQGHLYKKISKGEPFEFNGRTINPREEGLIDPPTKGVVISYSGDTRICQSIIDLAKDADLLITECTFASEHQDQAEENKHMSTTDVIYLAKSSNVKNIIATHISNRYKESSIILEELQKELTNVFVANDLDAFQFRGSTVSHLQDEKN